MNRWFVVFLGLAVTCSSQSFAAFQLACRPFTMVLDQEEGLVGKEGKLIVSRPSNKPSKFTLVELEGAVGLELSAKKRPDFMLKAHFDDDERDETFRRVYFSVEFAEKDKSSVHFGPVRLEDESEFNIGLEAVPGAVLKQGSLQSVDIRCTLSALK